MIEDWLTRFKHAWTSKNIDDVMALFSDDVTYYETPFLKVSSYADLKREWQAIAQQNNITLELEVFSSSGNKHTVVWHLSYDSTTGAERELRGTYLIELNDDGLCRYFHHTGEARQNTRFN